MKCPFSGKPCLLPKEIFVTEVKDEGVRNLFLCKMCGEDYIKSLSDAEVVTKALEVISSGDSITHSETVIEDDKPAPVIIPPERKPPQAKFMPRAVTLMRQLLQVEAKLQAAVHREDYESAAQLRDILADLKQSIEDINTEEDEPPTTELKPTE